MIPSRVRYSIHATFLCFWLLLSSCSPKSDDRTVRGDTDVAQAAGGEQPQTGEAQWVDPNSIRLGPIRRDTLTEEQIGRIEALQSTFVEVDGQSISDWVDNFKRDLDPDSELAVWERMAHAYTSYCEERSLSLEAKKEVYGIVLLRSMASPEDVLERLDLNVLSKNDAIEVMRGFS